MPSGMKHLAYTPLPWIGDSRTCTSAHPALGIGEELKSPATNVKQEASENLNDIQEVAIQRVTQK